MKISLTESVHRLTNQMQLVLFHLDVESRCPLGYPCRETHEKALGATRASIAILYQLSAALRTFVLIMPAGESGSAIVAPHHSKIVSHDDLVVDIPADEVKVVDVGEIREGEGDHNPRTK
jgi:hypothetical protein